MGSTSIAGISCPTSGFSVTTIRQLGVSAVILLIEYAWFFNGVRRANFPTEHLKIEPWFVNGWQSYADSTVDRDWVCRSCGGPNGWLSVLGNQYALGEEALAFQGRVRYHSDDSIENQVFR